MWRCLQRKRWRAKERYQRDDKPVITLCSVPWATEPGRGPHSLRVSGHKENLFFEKNFQVPLKTILRIWQLKRIHSESNVAIRSSKPQGWNFFHRNTTRGLEIPRREKPPVWNVHAPASFASLMLSVTGHTHPHWSSRTTHPCRRSRARNSRSKEKNLPRSFCLHLHDIVSSIGLLPARVTPQRVD